MKYLLLIFLIGCGVENVNIGDDAIDKAVETDNTVENTDKSVENTDNTVENTDIDNSYFVDNIIGTWKKSLDNSAAYHEEMYITFNEDGTYQVMYVKEFTWKPYQLQRTSGTWTIENYRLNLSATLSDCSSLYIYENVFITFYDNTLEFRDNDFRCNYSDSSTVYTGNNKCDFRSVSDFVPNFEYENTCISSDHL